MSNGQSKVLLDTTPPEPSHFLKTLGRDQKNVLIDARMPIGIVRGLNQYAMH